MKTGIEGGKEERDREELYNYISEIKNFSEIKILEEKVLQVKR